MEVRIGNILVDRGILTTDQVKAVLNVQHRTGQPFGLICEELYDVDPSQIESAWAAIARSSLEPSIRDSWRPGPMCWPP